MKLTTLPLLSLILASICYSGCTKTGNFEINPHSVFDKAKTYFEDTVCSRLPKNSESSGNPLAKLEKMPQWDKAYVQLLSVGNVIIVPVAFDLPVHTRSGDVSGTKSRLSELSKLLIYQDRDNKFHYKFILPLPDDKFRQSAKAAFTGLILVSDWVMNPEVTYQYTGIDIISRETHFPVSTSTAPKQTTNAPLPILDCIVTNWYSCTDECTYLFSSTSCTTIYIPTESSIPAEDYGIVTAPNSEGTGGTPTAGIVDGPNLVFQYPTAITGGIDLAAFFTCLTAIPDAGATYSMTLCTDLPENSNPDAILNSSFSPGHTFITLTKTNGNTSGSLSFGFYPNSSALSAINIPVPSMIQNDGNTGHEYNASITLHNLSVATFQDIQTRAINAANAHSYILTEYNCTNYALDLFNSATVNPIVVPDWLGPITGFNFGKTPNGVYKALYNMQGRTNTDIYIGMANASRISPCS